MAAIKKINSRTPKLKNIGSYKTTFILDPGHGGLVNGVYVTPGKRSPVFPDGSVLYEGVNNRKNVEAVKKLAESEGLKVVDIVNSNKDVSLVTRVKNANLYGTDAVYISFHSDAVGDGKTWEKAKGISVFTSIGQTKSDKFADIVFDKLKRAFPTMTMRECRVDGDSDKEHNFYVLVKTRMPAILLELGFHTNLEEARFIQTEEFRNLMARAVVDSMITWENQRHDRN